MPALPFAAAAIAALFTFSCLRRARARSSPALAVWAVALAQFAVAAAALAWGAAFGWTPALFRLYYLFGAILNVAWLGLGTIWLFGPRAVAWAASGLLVAASAYAGWTTATAELLPGAEALLARRDLVSGASVFGEDVRDWSRVFSYAGTAVLLGGLGWSLWRRRGASAGLAMLFAGALVVLAVSVFARRGAVGPFSVGLLAGVALMYLGFLRTTPPDTGARARG